MMTISELITKILETLDVLAESHGIVRAAKICEMYSMLKALDEAIKKDKEADKRVRIMLEEQIKDLTALKDADREIAGGGTYHLDFSDLNKPEENQNGRK